MENIQGISGVVEENEKGMQEQINITKGDSLQTVEKGDTLQTFDAFVILIQTWKYTLRIFKHFS